jgi:hypothetical protein
MSIITKVLPRGISYMVLWWKKPQHNNFFKKLQKCDTSWLQPTCSIYEYVPAFNRTGTHARKPSAQAHARVSAHIFHRDDVRVIRTPIHHTRTARACNHTPRTFNPHSMCVQPHATQVQSARHASTICMPRKYNPHTYHPHASQYNLQECM